MDRKGTEKVGLVLSGGGARSAFQIICGISGGAINGAYLASRANQMPDALQDLWSSWNEIKLDDVMEASSARIFGTASKLILQLGLGGIFNARPTTQLLSTAPLVRYLLKKLDFRQIQRHIESGLLHGVAMTTTHYGTGSTVTFFDGVPSLQPWMRSHRIGKRTNLTLKHVLASSAIPLLFPPIKIQGAYYGDGAVRMTSPLSPAIHLGSSKVIAIGVRYHRSPIETFELNQSFRMRSVQLADISGVLLNALFMDALDSDLERMMRINQTLSLLTDEDRREHPEKLRRIPVLAIRPSQDLGRLAVDEFRRFSWVLRHFLRGLGASEHHGSDLLSYLAFEKSYTSRLLQLGFKDVMAEKARVLAWLREKP
ncbi:patatin-like phospholipase family protein [Bdellovibrionota bacterium FG-1]